MISAERIDTLMPELNSARNSQMYCRVGAGRRPRTMLFSAKVLVILIALFSPPVWTHAEPPLNSQLDLILRRELPSDHCISIQVADFNTGKILMERASDQPLIPASTLKVVTTSTALQVLNPDFRFATEIYIDGARNGSVGNLYIRGLGDPHLVSEELFRLTRDLKDRGLAHVRGDIVVDESYFNPGKPLDENEKLGFRAYHAPYGALSLNFNSIKIIAVPSSKLGEDAQIIMDPASEYARLEGRVKTVKGSKPLQTDIDRRVTKDGHEIISVNGSIGSDAPIKGRYINMLNPGLYAGYVFKEFLLREDIRVDGSVIKGNAPKNASSYMDFYSIPLGALVYWLNKYSNNFMAEQINMAMGAQVHGAPGTREKGLAVIRKHLEACGVKEADYSISEASGLSRNNKISAAAMVKVLLNTAYDFSYNAEFMASLSVAGTDGTMKEKFTDPQFRRRLRAKTGTLRGVNALAGFGVSIDNRPFVFAALVNSNQKNPGFINYADRIMKAILQVPMKSTK